jgi:peptide chain release factor 2
MQLEEESSRPGFWDDPAAAQAAMRRLSQAREVVSTWQEIERSARDLRELAALAQDDEALATEVEAETRTFSERLDKLEFELSFSGPYDRRGAIVAIHAGAGGTESQDWAEMLMRMYLRWAERRGYTADIIDVMPGDEAGIKSATLEIDGRYAYGRLRSERGVHRLVRLSPFDADHARHTSFALVEVMPLAEGSADVTINPDDLRVDVFRSSGHGGQNVQKNATAVRITHVPTGIVATCQNERSQYRNRESAMRVLEARLLEKEVERQAEEQSRIKGEHVSAGWGNQIRSYVLHPYKMVKDHRTDYETSDPDAVLDGDLDPFMDAYLKMTMGGNGH